MSFFSTTPNFRGLNRTLRAEDRINANWVAVLEVVPVPCAATNYVMLTREELSEIAKMFPVVTAATKETGE